MWLTGGGCKEVYRFPHISYPYSSCIGSFWQQHPYFFVHFLKNFFVLVVVVDQLDYLFVG